MQKSTQIGIYLTRDQLLAAPVSRVMALMLGHLFANNAKMDNMQCF